MGAVALFPWGPCGRGAAAAAAFAGNRLMSAQEPGGPPPGLPDEIVDRTRATYVEAYERLTGRQFG